MNIGNTVKHSIRNYISKSIWDDSMYRTHSDSIRYSVSDSIRNSISDSIWNSVRGLVPNPKDIII